MWLDRLNVWLLCALLVLAPVAADASQNALSSPATGTVSGLQLTNNYNNAIDSLNTCSSGSTAPTNQLSGAPSLGNCWLNTTSIPYPVSRYDGSSWLTPFWLDATNHYTDVKIGGGVATVASASSVDLCASANAPQAVISISGTVTINSFGSTCNPGHVKILSFQASLTITNSGSLILPGATNIVTQAGDQAAIYPVSSGVWQILVYTPANGQAIVNDLASGLCAAQLTWSPQLPSSSKYVLAAGQAISRSSFAAALTACTITQSVSSTIGSPTLTGFSDTTQIAAGAAIEAAFIPNGITIVSCTSGTCLMSGNATASTSGNVTIFPYGNGCGIGVSCASPSTTFNVPDCRDVGLVGRGNMGGTARSDNFQLTATFFGASPNALGVFGGAQSYFQQRSDLVNVAPTFAGSAGTATSTGNFATSGNFSTSNAVSPGGGSSYATSVNVAPVSSTFTPAGTIQSLNGGVTQTAMPRVPPSQTINCMVRVIAQRDVPVQRFAGNDNRLPDAALIERRRLAA